VGETGAKQRQREGDVFVGTDVGGEEGRGQGGVVGQPGVDGGGHLNGVAGNRDVPVEERIAVEARLCTHLRRHQARRMREAQEDLVGESVVGELLGIERRLTTRKLWSTEAQPQHDNDEMSKRGLEEARVMTVVQQSLDQWEHAEVERSRVQATLSAAVAPTGRDIIERYANPPGDTVFPLEYLYHLVGDVSGQRVLDYGCGDGPDTTLLASRGARVEALDLSPDLLQRAAERLRLDGFAHLVTFHCGSAHEVPLPDDSVDLVVGHAILHHLDLAEAAREVFRVLKPGGRALFLEPVRDSKLLRAIRPLIPYRQPDISPFERPLLLAEIDAFSQKFRAARRREFLLPFVALSRILRAPLDWQNRLRAIDGRLLARYPWLRYYATITVFELFKPEDVRTAPSV
jgi:SAM-dependent methyltransferase